MLNRTCSLLLLPFVLCGAILGSFDARDLAKVPNVLQHYHHHKIAHGQPDLSFLDFLTDHFHAGGEQDPEHEDLPILGGCSTAPSVLPVITPLLSDGPQPSGIVEPLIEFCVRRPSDGRSLDVFQPPRIA